MAKFSDERSEAESHDVAVRKKGTVHLRITSLVTAAFLGIAAIALAYIGGVMSGRHAEQRHVSSPASPIEVMPQAAEESQKDKPGILAAEDLKFAKVLRNEGNAPLEKISPDNSSVSDAETKKTEQQTQNTFNGPDSTEAKNKIDAAIDTSENTDISHSEKIVAPLDDSILYDYVFQMGAFRDESAVDRLRQTLEGHGLRTAMQKDGKIFLVLVRLRGTEARAAEIKTLARELGLGEPVTRSRVDVKN